MSGPASLSIRGVSKAFAATEVLTELDLEATAGEVLVLLGPSGSGKTTLLRLIAGLEVPDAGEVWIGGEAVSSPEAFVPTERRRVGMVFQDGALFPHVNVARNVGFGLARGERKAGARIDEMLDLVGLAGFGDRSIDSLSGGQRQRVALARALAPEPRLLLMDEPFSNLDAVLRRRLRREVRTLLAGTDVTTVFVTHDRDEAFSLGDRVAVLHHGVLAQIDEPRALYERPASQWLASFVGDAGFVPATVVSMTDDAHASAATPWGPTAVDLIEPARTGDEVVLLIRPDSLGLQPLEVKASDRSAPDAPSATVVEVDFLGDVTLLTVRLDAGPTVLVRLASRTAGALVPGARLAVAPVEAGWRPVAYPAS